MALQRKLTPEELEKKRLEVLAIKKANEEQQIRILEKNAAIFRKTPGKILKVFCVVATLISLTFFIDQYTEIEFKPLSIQGANEEMYDIITKSGTYRPMTCQKVILGEQKALKLLIPNKYYEIVEPSGIIKIGFTKIFNHPKYYIIGDADNQKQYPILPNYALIIFLPVLIIFISIFWLFIDASASQTTFFFGYFCMVVVPLLTLFMVSIIISQLNYSGDYEMNLNSLEFLK